MEGTVEKIINYAIAQVKDFSHQERWAILDEVSHRLIRERNRTEDGILYGRPRR